MRNGWTGGQYSLWRFALGVFLMVRVGPWGLLPGLLFGVGLLDRVAAIALALLCHDAPLLAGLCLVHLFVPRAPYLSWAARGRVDPGGGWQLHNGICLAAWVLLLVAYGSIPLRGVPDGFVLLHLLAFNPGWIRGRTREGTMFFDGGCGLCHRSVRFALAEGRAGFRFAPLGGETFRATFPNGNGLPDSVVLQTADGVLVRSAAIVATLTRLGGYWRVLGTLLWLIPRPLRDLGYDTVARIRLRLFDRPDEACPVLPPSLRARFVP